LAFATARGWGDSIQPLGDVVGDLPDNKTGDLVVRVGGPDGPAIAIEVKFDKNFKFGDVADSTHENKNLADIAWSQVVEAAENRDAELAMIVFDKGSLSPSVKENLEDVLWMPGGGLAVMVDVERDDLRNLTTVYSFARSLLLAMTRRDLGAEMLSVVVSRASREVRRCLDARGHIDKIVSSAGALIVDLEQSHAELDSILRVLESVDADHPLGATELLTLHEGAEVRKAIADSKKEFEGRGNT
jgi:hypothetical protein